MGNYLLAGVNSTDAYLRQKGCTDSFQHPLVFPSPLIVLVSSFQNKCQGQVLSLFLRSSPLARRAVVRASFMLLHA